jgi:hypothetical protein
MFLLFSESNYISLLTSWKVKVIPPGPLRTTGYISSTFSFSSLVSVLVSILPFLFPNGVYLKANKDSHWNIGWLVYDSSLLPNNNFTLSAKEWIGSQGPPALVSLLKNISPVGSIL